MRLSRLCQTMGMYVGGALLLSGCVTGERAYPGLSLLSQAYPSPQYVTAWSCQSESEALTTLVTQLGVVIDTRYEHLTQSRNLRVSRQSQQRVGLRGIQQVRGLIVKRAQGCVFMAVDTHHAKSLYRQAIQAESVDVGRMLLTLSNVRATSLQKFRAGVRLRRVLLGLQADTTAMALLTDKQLPRVGLSVNHERELKRALSFSVVATETHDDDPHVRRNDLAVDVVSQWLNQQGYWAEPTYENPAFQIRVDFTKIVIPGDPMSYRTDIDVSLRDNTTGDTLARSSGHYTQEFGMNGFGAYNREENHPRALRSVLAPIADFLEQNTQLGSGSRTLF